MCLLFSLALTSFNSRTTNIAFEKALQEKKIEVVIVPTGGHSGKCITVQVKNLTKGPLNLELSPGTIFVPENEEEQTLITAQTQLLAINKNEVKNFSVLAYCSEASDKCPTKDSKFGLSKTQNVSLNQLAGFLDSLKGLDDHVIQQAIWCVTDSESVSNVYTEDPKVSKTLRNYLCSLTGQKDTWYNTQRAISVDANNNIIRVAKEIKGDIVLESTVPVELQGAVMDSTGKVIFQNPNKTRCPAGKIKFEFKLKVEGWAPGEYAVVYTNNGQEVLRQSFSF